MFSAKLKEAGLPRAVYMPTLEYTLKLITDRQYEAALKEHVDYETARTIRLDLLNNAYTGRNLKTWAYYNMWNYTDRDRALLARAERFGVGERDARMALPAMRSIMDQYDQIDLASEEVVMFDYDYLDDLLSRVVPDLRKHALRYVRHKMRFIANAYNMEFHDLANDLVATAIGRFYRLFPTVKSELHITNSLRAAINGLGVNMIEYYTSSKRARLVADGQGGYTLVTASQNQIGDMNYDDNSSVSGGYGKVENKILIESIYDTVKPMGKRQLKLIELLSGLYNDRFSRWLNAKGYSDNDELADVLPLDRYVVLVSEYLEMTTDSATSILNELRVKYAT